MARTQKADRNVKGGKAAAGTKAAGNGKANGAFRTRTYDGTTKEPTNWSEVRDYAPSGKLWYGEKVAATLQARFGKGEFAKDVAGITGKQIALMLLAHASTRSAMKKLVFTAADRSGHSTQAIAAEKAANPAPATTPAPTSAKKGAASKKGGSTKTRKAGSAR